MEEVGIKDTRIPSKTDEEGNRYPASNDICTQMEEKQRNKAIVRKIFLLTVVCSVFLILCLAILWVVVYHMLKMSDIHATSALNGYW